MYYILLLYIKKYAKLNDCSTEKEYYEYNWDEINIIHLEENNKALFGYACAGYVRNKGIEQVCGILLGR